MTLDPLPPFEHLVKLAKTNSRALDRLLDAHVDALIDSAPQKYQQRLRGLQFEIDCHRQIQKNSFEACKKISLMMQDSLMKLNRVLNESVDVQDTAVKANVLSLNVARS